MQMRMMPQSLAPGVQHSQETNLGAEVFRVSGDSAQRLCRAGEEQVVNDALILQGQRGELLWQGEDDVKVFDRQQVSQPRFEPAGFRQ